MSAVFRAVLGGLGLLAAASWSLEALAEPPFERPTNPVSSFSKAKKLARNEVYAERRITLYCGCSYTPSSTSGGRIGTSICGYVPRKSETRGRRLEWEHIMPASTFGSHRQCWREGHPRCVNKKGKPYARRKCCAKSGVDPEFAQMEADLHNLAPSVGELNGDRSNLPYGLVDGELRLYGACDFEIGGAPKLTEPAEDIRGDVARVWLYMIGTYDLEAGTALMRQLNDWDAADPVSDWEKTRDARIKVIQGNGNPKVAP